MSSLRCYAPVIVLLMWAGTWQLGFDDTAIIPPWLVMVAVAVVIHIREIARRHRAHR